MTTPRRPLADIIDAARRLEGVAVRTPVVRDGELEATTGAEVHLKVEALQRSGSFKFRGAHTRLTRLVDRGAPPGGVVAVSSGNYAAAVACSAQVVGLPATVFMPTDAPDLKRSIAESHGANVVSFDRAIADREAPARAFADDHDAEFVHPYEDPDVQSGQGTTALEFDQQVPGLDVLLVPMGGGGLMAGCASAMSRLQPDCLLIGVEPERGDDWQRSLRAGQRVRIAQPDTIADGLALVCPGESTFAINRALVDEVLTVTEDQIAEAVGHCFDRLDLIVEPSGAVGVAALAAIGSRWAGRRVGVVLTGGNIAEEHLAALRP